jgi:DNA-binding response OmpR family regulator
MAKEKIVVIDDSPIVRKLAELALEEEGYKVYTAEDGEEGLRICEEVRPAVILVDFIMPRISGYQFCEAARDNELLKDIPIILITGKGEDVGKKFAEKFGVVDYFIKPFKSEILVEKVNAIIYAQKMQTGGEAGEPAAATLEASGLQAEPAQEEPSFYGAPEAAAEPARVVMPAFSESDLGYAEAPAPESMLKAEEAPEPVQEPEPVQHEEVVEQTVGLQMETGEQVAFTPVEEPAGTEPFTFELPEDSTLKLEEPFSPSAEALSEPEDIFAKGMDAFEMPEELTIKPEEAVSGVEELKMEPEPVPAFDMPAELPAEAAVIQPPAAVEPRIEMKPEAAFAVSPEGSAGAARFTETAGEDLEAVCGRYFEDKLPYLIEKTLEDLLRRHGIIKDSAIVFSGDLANIPCIEALKMAWVQKLTGKFSVFSKAGSAEIYFDKGDVVYALTSKQGSSLTSRRIAVIKKGERHEAEGPSAEGIADSVVMAADFHEGNFFFEMMTPPRALMDFGHRGNILGLVLQGLKKRADETDGGSTLGPSSVMIRAISDSQARAIGMNSQEIDVFLSVDGGSSLADIGGAGELGVVEVTRIVSRLQKAGVLAERGDA